MDGKVGSAGLHNAGISEIRHMFSSRKYSRITFDKAAPCLPVKAPPPAWRSHKEAPLYEAAVCILQKDGGIMPAGNPLAL